jgi:4-amino-4-deoxy-L-arabinose transferase-like glycosyltransferase
MMPAGACAAVFVFASPIFGIDGSSAYIDVAVACIVFGIFYLLELWDTWRAPDLAIPIGLLSGFAYAAKFTAVVALPYAIGFIIWRSRRFRQPYLKPALTVAGCALLVMAPWMVKNWIWLQNPFSPFLNSVFPNPFIQVGFERELSQHMRVSAAIWNCPGRSRWTDACPAFWARSTC